MKRFSLGCFAVLILSLRSSATPKAQMDLDVLNYALVLEHLEFAFYRDGISLLNQSGSSNESSKVYPRLLEILDHEETHVKALTSVITSLGGTPVKECTYDFGFSNSTGDDFLAVARILENVGVSAYTGAIHEINSGSLLTAAATIATIEARHASYLNNVNGKDPFPTAFDSPLDMRAVVGLAGGFIVSCPDNITITPYPKLTVSPLVASIGSWINVTGIENQTSSSGEELFCVFYSGSASANSTLNVKGECLVPDGAFKGDNYLFVMSNQVYDLLNNTGILGGPALIFVV